jgi:hypothetical protein
MTQTQNGFTDIDMEKIKELKAKATEKIIKTLDKGFLAGGCYTSWWHGEVPKDYDVFVTSEHVKSNIRLATENNSHRYVRSDASYLKNDNVEDVILDNETNIQYILVKYKNRKELIDHFDAIHTAISFDPYINVLYASPLTIHCIKNKILKPHNNNKIAEWRRDKFIKKGFKLETVSV